MRTLDIEKVRPGIYYALTVNLAGDDIVEFRTKYADYVTFFYKKFKHCVFRVYPEISPLGRLHYHGYIRFDTPDDIVMFYIDTIRSMVFEKSCDIAIAPLGDFGDMTWYYYCRKQKHIMKPFFRKSKIKYKLNSANLPVVDVHIRNVKDQMKAGINELDYNIIMHHK